MTSGVVPAGLPSLAGRTALITGAGNGLGRAMAHCLSSAGVRVIAAGRTRGNLDATLTGLEGEHRVVVVDVADPESVQAMAQDLAGEEVSILVNNAGVPGPVKDLVDITPDEWDDVFGVNVRGVYLVCRAMLPPMISRGFGDVVNVASVSGKRPLAMRTPYTASKMAVIGLTTTLGFEVGGSGVRVNSLSPGPVRGPRMERNFRLEAQRLDISAKEAERRFASRAALGRLLEEREVGEALVAMLLMTGLHCADIDLSAGMVAR